MKVNWYAEPLSPKNFVSVLHPTPLITRKSSCVTARGVPPGAYPVHVMCCPRGWGRGGAGEEERVPFYWSWLGEGRTTTWLGYPLPPEKTWDQRLEKGPRTRDWGTPMERTWDRRLEKGPRTTDWGSPLSP